MFSSLSQFYISDKWRSFRQLIISERTNPADGNCYCEECHKIFKAGYEIIAHHKKPLTMANVNDYTVSLNPENISLVCGTCHNKIHNRFGYCSERKVYLITGAPCSGKTTFVNENKGNSDLIIDIDNIWQCITGGERYYKPNALKTNAFIIRDCLLDMVKTRTGKWERAWIIEGLPHRAERERKAALLGAEVIHIDTDEKTCLWRLANDESRILYKEEWTKYINDYFSAYQE